MRIETARILEKIKSLEAEKERLMQLRKEEVFKLLQTYGGLALDNRLLVGLAICAANPSNNQSSFLKELRELAIEKMPIKRGNSRGGVNTKEKDEGGAAPAEAIAAGKING